LELKKKRVQSKEIQCPECGATNILKLPQMGGTITIFCKDCGEEIHFTFDRTIMEMELKGLSAQRENPNNSQRIP